jgi:signal transduction histidine kinase/CheY-like chemotaxis protein/ABC-type amino acid transport substrate-binding protein
MKNLFMALLLSIFILIPGYYLKADIPISVLKIGVYNNPPKISVSGNGAATGYHIEILDAILKETPYRIEYHPGTWEEGLSRLKKGEIDIMPDVAWSEERAAVYDFNNEYILLNWACIYSSKTATINIITDLDNKIVAVMRNSIHTEGESGIINQVSSFGISCEFIYVDTYEKAFELIDNGTADAAVVNRLYGLMNEESSSVKRTSIIFNPSQIRYAFTKNRPGNSNLIKLVDSRIIELKADKNSVFHRAFTKYLLPQIKKERILPEWTDNIVFLAILLSLILSIYVLTGRSGKNESNLLRKFFRENVSMEIIRSNITDNSLTALALFSIPLFLSILYHGYQIGRDNTLWLYLCVVIISVSAAALRKHLSVMIKLSVLILSLFLMGSLVLKSWGRIGTGFTFFLTAGIIITLIYGKRSGIAIITTGLIITVIFGILIQYRIIQYNFDMITYSLSPSSWIFAVMAVFMMFFTIISGIEKFYANLVSAVDNLEQKVQERTNELDDVNKNLQKEIDIRKKIEDELLAAKLEAEHASSAKGTFLASMSHEIRTPLNAILGYSQILLREKTLAPESRREIEIINSSGEHLLDLINEILDMSKIEAGKIEIINESFSLSGVIKQIENLFSAKTEKKGIEFIVKTDDDIPDFIIADKSKLKQILINLTGNAVKFTDKGSVKINISLSENDSEILIFCIKDTGKGIAKEHLESIFAPFEQTVDGKDRGGTGLGLSISRKYANLMGGDISLESIPGIGSSFTLSTPFKKSDIEIIDETDSDRKVIGIQSRVTPRILIVDDREVNRDILVRMLEPLGFNVHEASGGIEALDLIKSWKPDLVLLDLIMPDLDGREVIKTIKADPLLKSIKIIVITASVLDIAREEILNLGADAFIRKPFRETVVLNEISDTFGLEYVYDETTRNTIQTPLFVTGPELKKMLQLIPTDVREYLKNSLITGDIEEVNNSIKEISGIDPKLAKQIGFIIDDFEFNSMIEILNSI